MGPFHPPEGTSAMQHEPTRFEGPTSVPDPDADRSPRGHIARLGRPLAWTATGAILATTLLSATTAADDRYDDLSLFSHVINLVRAHYVEEIDEHRLLRGAIRGVMKELDPHSTFMDPDAYREMQIDTRGEFNGLGIEITKAQGGAIEVVSKVG